MTPATAARRPDELEHDMVRGVLNGVEFDMDAGDDPVFYIKPLPCEVCGHPVFLGVITSTCGDTAKDVWEEHITSLCEGYLQHECYGSPEWDELPDCPVCFPEAENLDDVDMASVAR